MQEWTAVYASKMPDALIGMSSAVLDEEFDSGIIVVGFIGCGISCTVYQKNFVRTTHAVSKWWNVVLSI